MSRVTVFVAVAIIALAAATALDAAPSDADLQRCLSAAADAANLSGVAVIAHGGVPVATIAHGAMGSGDARPVAVGTRFNIASAGKMFTAVAVAQLVEAGKVRFEDTVGRFLPDAPTAIAALRVDQLLTHTSGLGDYLGPANLAAADAAQAVGDFLRLVYADPPAALSATLLYSNSGFVVLGAIVEKASGEPFDQYLARHVFGPAGMGDTTLHADPARTATPVSAIPGAVPPANAGMSSPAGGTFSTAADLVAFMKAIADRRLVSADALKAKLPPDVARGAPTIQAGGPPMPAPRVGGDALPGLEWITGQRPSGQGGGAPGVNSFVMTTPGFAGTIAVLSNRDPPAAQAFVMRVAPWINAATCG